MTTLKTKSTKTTPSKFIKVKMGPKHTCPNLIAVEKHNQIMTKLVRKINELQIPAFGSGLYRSDNNDCVFYNTDTIIASTIADRIVNKFEEPDEHVQRQLWRECSIKWVDFERNHVERHGFDSAGVAARATVYRARKRVNQVLFQPRPGHKTVWQWMDEAPFAFGPGESFISVDGDVSTFSKLNNLANWTVTVDAAESASYFIAVNRGLRECLAKFFARKRLERRITSRRLGRKVKVLHKLDCNTKDYGVAAYASRVLHEFFYQYPIHHKKARVLLGSKGTSVYKNRKSRRKINKECLINIIMQKIPGYGIRQCLKQVGIDLDIGQSKHRRMIASNRLSTIDESNASDSIVHSTCKQILWDKRFVKIIETLRSSYCLLETFPDEKPNGINLWHPINKTSAMGNGFTFELLTLILYSVCYHYDKQVSVYGDDIICTNESVQDIVSAITGIGFIVNEKKSFFSKPLRESCGAFYLDGRGYITCYDMKWARDVSHVIMTFNKLGRILRWNLHWNHTLRDLLVEAYESLRDVIPRNYAGPVCSFKDIPQWAEFENYATSLRNNKVVNKLYARHSVLLSELSKMYHLDTPKMTGKQTTRLLKNQTNDFDFPSMEFVVHQQREKRLAQRLPVIQDVKSVALLYTYVLIGTRTPMMYRESKKRPSHFRNVTCFISPNGTSIRAGTARRIVKTNCYAKLLACLNKTLELKV